MHCKNLFSEVLLALALLTSRTQSSPIRPGWHHPEVPQPFEELIAWREGFYQPQFPGPYTLLPGIPGVVARTIEPPAIHTASPTSRHSYSGNPSPSLEPRHFTRFHNTSIASTGSTIYAEEHNTTTTPGRFTRLHNNSVITTTITTTLIMETGARSARTRVTAAATSVSSSLTALTTSVSSLTAAAIPTANPLAGSASLRIAFENNLASANMHVYVTGLDSNGQVVMLTTQGSFYYPSTSSQTPQPISAPIAIPLSSLTNSQLTIPGYISSCRLWFADGTLDFSVVATAGGPGIVSPTSVNPTDPSHNVNWGFVELTYNESGLFANISYVDFVGLPLGIKLSTAQGGAQSAAGVPADAVAKICKKLKALASADGQPWDQLCVYSSSGRLIRVNSPGSFMSSDSSAFLNYFDNYVNSVWELYRRTKLIIKTQNGQGRVACQVGQNDLLTCAGDNRAYARPSAADIFGCNSGPFSILPTDNSIHLAVVPRLCAAFNRATLHVKGGHLQPNLPPKYYYPVQPNNKYSDIVHQVEIDGRGYAFSYDDVAGSPKTNVAGSVYSTQPQLLTVIVGGPKKAS